MISAIAVLVTAAATLTADGPQAVLLRRGGDPARGLLVNHSPGRRPFDPPDPGLPTVVFIHGINPLPGLVHFTMAERLAESLARRGGPPRNVLAWDWNAATVESLRAAPNSEAAVRQGPLLAWALWTAGLDPARTHLIGHSSGGMVATSAARTFAVNLGRPVAHLTLLEPATYYHAIIFERLRAGSLAPLVENYWAPGPSAYGKEVALPGVRSYRVDGPASYAGVLCPLQSDHLYIVRWYLETIEHPGLAAGFNRGVLFPPVPVESKGPGFHRVGEAGRPGRPTACSMISGEGGIRSCPKAIANPRSGRIFSSCEALRIDDLGRPWVDHKLFDSRLLIFLIINEAFGALIRFPESSAAVFAINIWSGTHRSDDLPRQTNLSPRGHHRLLHRLVVRIHLQGPVVAPQVMPQVLHRVQLRRVRRQQDQADIRWHHQHRAGVVPRTVPHQHRMHPGGQLPGELLQEHVDHSHVEHGRDQAAGMATAGTHRRQDVEIAVLVLPHPTWPGAGAGPHPAERPLLTHAGLVLEINMDLPLGVRLGDRLDLVGDDLLEEGLQLLVGILVLGSRHEAGEAQAVQQVIHRLQAHDDAELILEDAPVVVPIEGGPTLLGCGACLDASDEAGHLRPGEAGRSARSGRLLECVGAESIVASDPLLDGPLATAEGLDDLLGRSALDGEHDGLMPLPKLGVPDGIGPMLQGFESEMILDVHGTPPPAGQIKQLDLAGGRKPAMSTNYLGTVLYLDSLQGIEDNTRLTLKIHLNHAKRLLKADTAIDTMTLADADRYARTRMKESHRGKLTQAYTARKELRTFHRAWTWAKAHGRTHSLPAWVVDDVHLPKDRGRESFKNYKQITTILARGGVSDIEEERLWETLYLDDQELQELLAHVQANATAPWVYPMVMFVALTGCRRSEMVRSRIDDWNLDDNHVMIREKKRDTAVEYTLRQVDVHPRLLEVMTEWFQAHPGGQHTISSDGAEINLNTASLHFKRTLENHEKWSKVRGFHTLRHSVASILASKGVDQRYIDKLIGHHTEAMRKRYQHLFPKGVAVAINSLLGGGKAGDHG